MAVNLETPRKTAPRLRRCFISAQSGEASEALARALATHGVESLRADDLAPGARIVPETFRHLKAADFVCALVDGGVVAPGVFFELGAAHVLRKPILLFTTDGDLPFRSLHGIYTVKATVENLSSVAAEIDRFLRHAKPLPPLNEIPAEAIQKPNLSWARERLAALRGGPSAERGIQFEHLVAEVFQRTGGEVVAAESAGQDEKSGLLVWLDEISYQVGGPLLVRCKYYRSGPGSVLMNAKHTVEQLERLITASNAALALLVYDHDRTEPSPVPFETPRVLAFPIEQLIKSLERGTLPGEVVRRRQRAGYARMPVDGPH